MASRRPEAFFFLVLHKTWSRFSFSHSFSFSAWNNINKLRSPRMSSSLWASETEQRNYSFCYWIKSNDVHNECWLSKAHRWSGAKVKVSRRIINHGCAWGSERRQRLNGTSQSWLNIHERHQILREFSNRNLSKLWKRFFTDRDGDKSRNNGSRGPR